jgi:hypothetical protein
VEVLGDEPLAERVDRADVGALEQDELAEQARVAGLVVRLAQLLGDPGVHLLGGRLREGQHEHVHHVGTERAVRDDADAPAGEDRGLARPGRGGDEHVAAAGQDRLLLLLGPLDLACPSFALSSVRSGRLCLTNRRKL